MRRLYRFILLSTIGAVVSTQAFAGTLFVTSWGGRYTQAQAHAYFNPYTQKHGHRVILEDWGGALDRVRAMLARQHYTTHVLDAEGEEATLGCQERLFHKLNLQRIGVSEADLVPGSLHACGIATSAWSMVLAYNTTNLGENPTGWADLWDFERFPGERGLRLGPESTLEIALLADNVPRDQVYTQLATSAGLARAFDKLEIIAERTLWWHAGRQPVQALIDDEVSLTSAWHGRVIDEQQRVPSIQLLWHQQIMHFDYWVVPRGHPGTNFAYRFIEFATTPTQQAKLTEVFPYGPVHVGAFKLIKAETLRTLPTAPDNRRTTLLADEEFWVEHNDVLRQRFHQWLVKHQPHAAGQIKTD